MGMEQWSIEAVRKVKGNAPPRCPIAKVIRSPLTKVYMSNLWGAKGEDTG